MTDEIDAAEAIDVPEAPLNRKDITEEITGNRVNLDDLEDDVFGDPDTGIPEKKEETLNPLVGIMDQLIVTSPKMLEKRGYPSPNLEIWDDWAKPNLSKAFNAYMPDDVGDTLDKPVVCLALGFGALLFAFLPVILHFLDKRREKQEKEEQAYLESQKVAETEPIPDKKEYVGEYETPKPRSTAPISEGNLSKMQKFMQSGEGIELAGF